MNEAIMLMGGLGLVVGIGLAIASKVFYVYVDPLILAVDDVLPGANCGGCGLPGCTSNAEAIVAGKAAPNSCVAAGPETAETIAAILGVSVEVTEPDIALPGCTYGTADADTKFDYNGMNDCRAVSMLNGGMKVCTIGCLGLGTCAKVCPFDAITMGPNGLPVVHEGRCTGCGTCERACPKHIITLSSVTRRILKEYTIEDCTTPCQRACPAGINISGYISAMAEGNHAKAVRIIKERNPFPTVIGRICPRPCENECRRQYVDEPVAINFLKRYAADLEKEQGRHVQPYKAPSTERKVAIIGGGIEGLSTAFFSARLGHTTTVYDTHDKMGGLLRSAISRQRLPMDILDWDIEGIMEMGVHMETSNAVGKDLSISDLLAKGNNAVFLAVGGWDSRLVRTGGKGEGGPVPGCHLLIDIMKSGSEGYPQARLSGHVIVIGNPKLTSDMVQRCKDLGAQKVSVIVHEAAPTNLKAADAVVNAAVSRLYGKNNQLLAVDITDIGSGDNEKINADHIIFAAGRMPELIFITAPTSETNNTSTNKETSDIEWEALLPYKQPAYRQETGLMAEGDELTDFSAAIKAIGAGRRAAATIHQTLYGITLDLPNSVITPNSEIQNINQVSLVPVRPRQIMPVAPARQLAKDDELEKGFNAGQAEKESKRCLQCGLICYLQESQPKAAANS